MRTRRAVRAALVFFVAYLCSAQATTIAADNEALTVNGTVSVVGKNGVAADSGDVVIWLKSLDAAGPTQGAPRNPAPRQKFKMTQQKKRFDPPLLVVPVGSTVEFPNLDPFFHNVFSMFDGKRFDLGLYETGASRGVMLNTPGTCYVFCNIHPEMSAVVVVVDTPYYAVSTRAGAFSVPNVPPGRYALSVWHQRHKLERPADFPREIRISQTSTSPGAIRLIESTELIPAHKNKYGQEYRPPPPESPAYK